MTFSGSRYRVGSADFPIEYFPVMTVALNPQNRCRRTRICRQSFSPRDGHNEFCWCQRHRNYPRSQTRRFTHDLVISSVSSGRLGPVPISLGPAVSRPSAGVFYLISTLILSGRYAISQEVHLFSRFTYGRPKIEPRSIRFQKDNKKPITRPLLASHYFLDSEQSVFNHNV